MIDCHCHLADSRCFKDADRILSEGRAVGIRKWVLGGTDPVEWDRQAELAGRYPGQMFQNYGLHPWWVEKLSRPEIDSALAMLKSKLGNAQGLGETGLDFYEKRDPEKFDDQFYAFDAQVRLAVAREKPIVLHVVKAFDESLGVIKSHVWSGGGLQVPIMLHRYSGNEQQAKPWIEMGVMLSFTEAFIDPERGKKSRRTLLETPVEQILLETDGPDLPFTDLPRIYAEAAKVKGMELKAFQAQIVANIERFYRVDTRAKNG